MNRRGFLRVASVVAAVARVTVASRSGAAEPPAETTRIRIPRIASTCRSPEWLAEELLRTEGFTDVQYLPVDGTLGVERALASGEADLGGHFAAPVILRLEAGDPIVIVGGEHVGCFELLGTARIRTIRDLKGATVAVPALDPSPHAFLASMIASVGLDPAKDVNWVKYPPAESMRLLAKEKIDAFLGFPPVPQEFRAMGIGRVVVNSATDRPWSQYFCCMLVGNRQFVRKHPVAMKRALRAILKSADVCAVEPERVARFLMDRKYSADYGYALASVKSLPYGRWREYDAEDTVRFWSLRLREAGMLKASPQKILGDGTDWRFLSELRKELKG